MAIRKKKPQTWTIRARKFGSRLFDGDLIFEGTWGDAASFLALLGTLEHDVKPVVPGMHQRALPYIVDLQGPYITATVTDGKLGAMRIHE